MLDDEIQEAKPFVRSIVALLVYLRNGTPPSKPAWEGADDGVKSAYAVADKFWSKFEADLKK